MENRHEFLCDTEKRKFFHAMQKMAQSDESSLEMLQMSDYMKTKLRSSNILTVMDNDKNFTRNIADLVLIAMSKNQQHVKAVAANSRRTT